MTLANRETFVKVQLAESRAETCTLQGNVQFPKDLP